MILIIVDEAANERRAFSDKINGRQSMAFLAMMVFEFGFTIWANLKLVGDDVIFTTIAKHLP